MGRSLIIILLGADDGVDLGHHLGIDGHRGGARRRDTNDGQDLGHHLGIEGHRGGARRRDGRRHESTATTSTAQAMLGGEPLVERDLGVGTTRTTGDGLTSLELGTAPGIRALRVLEGAAPTTISGGRASSGRGTGGRGRDLVLGDVGVAPLRADPGTVPAPVASGQDLRALLVTSGTRARRARHSHLLDLLEDVINSDTAEHTTGVDRTPADGHVIIGVDDESDRRVAARSAVGSLGVTLHHHIIAADRNDSSLGGMDGVEADTIDSDHWRGGHLACVYE